MSRGLGIVWVGYDCFRAIFELSSAEHYSSLASLTKQADIRADELMLKRFKKRKLLLKDQIAWIENALIPDQPA